MGIIGRLKQSHTNETFCLTAEYQGNAESSAGIGKAYLYSGYACFFQSKDPSVRLGITNLVILREIARAQNDDIVKWSRE